MCTAFLDISVSDNHNFVAVTDC
ncbi:MULTISPECIES: hypothetical protein [unclassified Bacillus (in: firmicutes)]